MSSLFQATDQINKAYFQKCIGWATRNKISFPELFQPSRDILDVFSKIQRPSNLQVLAITDSIKIESFELEGHTVIFAEF